MAKRLITLDYDAVRTAFDEEFRATRKLIESGYEWTLKDGRKVTLKVAINGGQAPQREDV